MQFLPSYTLMDSTDVFDTIMDCNFRTRCPNFLSKTIDMFKAGNYENLDTNRDECKHLTYVMNSQVHNRYYGNLCHLVLVYLFNPTLLVDGYTMKVDIHKSMCHSTLFMLYVLITSGYVKHNVVDYYGETPLRMLEYYQEKDRVHSSLACFLPAFKNLFKYGPGLISIQQRHIRSWLGRVKRKKAVKVIEDWWFEIANNPYSRAGKRLLATRGKQWTDPLYISNQISKNLIGEGC